jgi:uncharacterized protein (UPF0335 family)
MSNDLSFDKSTVSVQLIKQAVSQIEKLEEEKTEIMNQIKESFDNVRSQGIDVAVLKQLIRLRKKKRAEVIEQEELLELYRRALEQE